MPGSAELDDWLLGRYEVLAPAGEGGQATVFKARDHQHNRTVALKIRPAVHLDRPAAIAEAGVLLSLEPHPLLPLVRDDFFVEQRYVIVMDWVEGWDLGRLLREHGRPGLPLTSVLSYLAQAAQALTHLHAHDPVVIHCDVKPDNLILTKGGRVVLVDFGMSSGRGEARALRGGTSGFVAPEIAAGARPATAGDVYALAATAHALLTGRPPTGVAPDLSGLDQAAAAAVMDALNRGLALDPRRRPESPGELVERLRAGWHSTLPTGATTFMLTDVVGSTSLWDASPVAMSKALVRHDAIVTQAVEQAGGRLIKSMGEGDSTVSVFRRAGDGLRAALATHADLAAEEWPAPVAIRIRSALHTGEADLRDSQYFGPSLNRTARLRSLADASEILLSRVTAELVAADLPPGVELVELGPYALRGFGEPETVHAVSGPHVSAPPLSVCPYRGLAAFEEQDAKLYFGRRAAVREALERLRAHCFLAVVGASGSGKSSLVRAGIVPAVLEGALPGEWTAAVLVPGDDPLTALRLTLGQAAKSSSRTLVVVDQFEELFTRCQDRLTRTSFVHALLSSGQAKVLAIRADFYGHCASIPGLAGELAAHQLLLGPMSADELSESIEEPARAIGLHLQAGLTDRLVADVVGEPGALPLLSHALVETWERRDGRTLTLAGYQAAGGARGAIAGTAECTIAMLDNDRQRIARRVFLRLVEPGEGTEDTRRRATMSELAASDDADSVAATVEELAGARLITVDADGIEVAHEALIREWPRLREWIDEDRERLRSMRHLTHAAESWVRAGRDDSELYRGARLAAAERLNRAELAPIECEFLIACREASDREQEALRARVDEQARVNRRLRALLAGMTVLVVVALASGSVAFLQGQRADREARVARDANRVSSEQLARGFAAAAIDLRVDNPFLATMLAAESIARFRPALPEARSALLQSRIALGGRRLVPYGDPIPVGNASSVAVRPAGDLAVTGKGDGTIDLWDLQRRERIGQLKGPSGGILAMAFTADGRWLVVGSADSHVWRWDMSASLDSRRKATGTAIADLGAPAWAIAAAPAGDLVATTTLKGYLWLFDAATGERLGERLGPGGGAPMRVTFAPDGKTLLAGASAQGEVFAWSMPSRRLRFARVVTHTKLLWELAARPGSGEFVAEGADGKAKLWGLRTGARRRGGPFDSPARPVPVGMRGLTFGPDGTTLTLGGPDGRVYVWSLSKRRLVARSLPAHRAAVRVAARSADARLLVTLGDDRTLQVWTERARPNPLHRLSRLDARPTALTAGPDGRMLAVATDDGAVRLLDATTGKQQSLLGRRPGTVSGLAFVGDARLAMAHSDGTLTMWDIHGGRVRAARTGAHRGGLTSLAASPGGRPYLATAGADGIVRLWDATKLTPLGDPLGPLGARVTDVAFGPDGRTVAAATDRGKVSRWTIDGRPLEAFTVLDDTVWAIAIGPNDTLAAASADEVLSLWSLFTSRRPRLGSELGSHRGGALDVAFVGPATVAVTSGDGRLRLWDVASGAPIGPSIAVSTTPLRHLTTAPGGLIWTASQDGEMTRIDALSMRAACAAAAASFDRRQRARLLAGRPPLACRAGTGSA